MFGIIFFQFKFLLILALGPNIIEVANFTVYTFSYVKMSDFAPRNVGTKQRQQEERAKASTNLVSF